MTERKKREKEERERREKRGCTVKEGSKEVKNDFIGR